jgi:hypothetical protein
MDVERRSSRKSPETFIANLLDMAHPIRLEMARGCPVEIEGLFEDATSQAFFSPAIAAAPSSGINPSYSPCSSRPESCRQSTLPSAPGSRWSIYG